MATNKLFIHIFKDLEAGKLILPALPEVATKIRRTLNDPQVSIDDAANLIRVDPNLSAYILKIANSPFYQRLSPAVDIKTAIMRLGYITTRNICGTYAMRSLFKPRVNKLRPIMRSLWKGAADLGATSAVLASRLSNFPFDEALTAGLIQDIGILPILDKLYQHDPKFDLTDEAREVIEKNAAKISSLVLHKWHFHEDLVNVVRSRKDWMRDPEPEAQLADVVLIARLHMYISQHKRREYPPLHSLPAFSKLKLDELGPEEGLAILEEAKEEIDALRRLLL